MKGDEPETTLSVFSRERIISAPELRLVESEALEVNTRLTMDGEKFLKKLPKKTIPVAFLDPQYRGLLDKMSYGNEGKTRGKARFNLPQMDDEMIKRFIKAIDKALMPQGHLFLWIDKFQLCQGFRAWLKETQLHIVDLINWDKGRIGMGYRTRRRSEYCAVIQKFPLKAKGVWKSHDIPDTWREDKASNPLHPHAKPIGLQCKLISAVSDKGDMVIDPAAGSFSVLEAARKCEREFLGCDING